MAKTKRWKATAWGEAEGFARLEERSNLMSFFAVEIGGIQHEREIPHPTGLTTQAANHLTRAVGDVDAI